MLDVVEDLMGEKVYAIELSCLVSDFKANGKMVWHRDGMDRHQTVAEEMRILTRRLKTVQWNCSLYDGDLCFRLVPGSHHRPISAEKLACFKNDPRGDVPAHMVAELNAGQTIYYNNSVLHQGVYPKGHRRETLHGGMQSSKCARIAHLSARKSVHARI